MAVVQQKAGGAFGASNVHETFNTNVAKGNTIVVCVCAGRPIAGDADASCFDTIGTEYEQLEFVDDNDFNEHVYLYAGVAPASGANTVTFNTDAAPGDGAMGIVEVGGRATITPVGTRHSKRSQTATTTGLPGTGTDGVTAGAITAFDGDDYLMFVVDVSALRTGNYSAGTGQTEIAEGGDLSTVLDMQIQKKENVGAGSITGHATSANNDGCHVMACCVKKAVFVNSYLTTFAGANENPITEVGLASPIYPDGSWWNGAADGGDWGNGRVVSNKAYGTLATTFHDNTCILKGEFPADQWVRETIFRIAPEVVSNSPELEIRLRSTLKKHPNKCRGYEAAWGLRPAGGAYHIIVRWNGLVNDFDYMFNEVGAQHEVSNGDVFFAQIIGDILSTYRNGNLVASVNINQVVTDVGGAKWTDGAPGWGQNADTGTVDFDQYGLTKFEAGIPPLPINYKFDIAAQMRF